MNNNEDILLQTNLKIKNFFVFIINIFCFFKILEGTFFSSIISLKIEYLGRVDVYDNYESINQHKFYFFLTF